MTRLSDTEALVRQGIQKPGFQTSDEYRHPASDSADYAVSGPQPGKFQRQTGAGTETLAAATAICKE